MQIAPVLVELHAMSGLSAAKRTFMARVSTRIGAICIARRGGADDAGPTAPVVAQDARAERALPSRATQPRYPAKQR